MPHTKPTLTCEATDGILVVTVAARELTTIDAVARFERELRDASGAHGETRWLIDFGDATFFITPALKSLLAITRKLRAHGGELVLTGISPDVRYILGLMRLDALLHLCASVDVGLAALRSEAREVYRADAAGAN